MMLPDCEKCSGKTVLLTQFGKSVDNCQCTQCGYTSYWPQLARWINTQDGEKTMSDSRGFDDFKFEMTISQ
jgi:hypothetical protein